MSHLCDDKWKITFDKLNTYIKNEKKIPEYKEPLYNWLWAQHILYKAKSYHFNVKDVYDFWSKFIEEIKNSINDKDFNDNFNVYNSFCYLSWEDKLNELINFIETNKCEPKQNIHGNLGYIDEDLSMFLIYRQLQYTCIDDKFLSKKEYKEWEDFLEKYSKYLITCETYSSLILDKQWYTTFFSLKSFIINNNRFPKKEIQEEHKLYFWFYKQCRSYKNTKYLMTIKKYYNEWKKFIREYNKYFIEMYGTQFEKITHFMLDTQREEYEWNAKWNAKLTELREFVYINNKLPCVEICMNEKEIEIFKWYDLQNQRYEKRIGRLNKIKTQNDKRIRGMNDKRIRMMTQIEYEEWKKFIDDYELKNNCKLITSETEGWDFYFQKLKEFIDTNKRLPLSKNSYYEHKLSDWLNNNWSNTKLQPLKKEYNEYFVSNFEIFYISRRYSNWDAEFSNLKHFLLENKRKLNKENINEKEMLKWLDYYSKHLKHNMFPFCESNKNAIKVFTDFLEEYNKFN